jgi:hypothetical protein
MRRWGRAVGGCFCVLLNHYDFLSPEILAVPSDERATLQFKKMIGANGEFLHTPRRVFSGVLTAGSTGERP